jgi:hypothetical protein
MKLKRVGKPESKLKYCKAFVNIFYYLAEEFKSRLIKVVGSEGKMHQGGGREAAHRAVPAEITICPKPEVKKRPPRCPAAKVSIACPRFFMEKKKNSTCREKESVRSLHDSGSVT